MSSVSRFRLPGRSRPARGSSPRRLAAMLGAFARPVLVRPPRLRVARLAAGVALAGAVVAAPTASAGQPTVMPLNPPPPDTYTCTPVGNGTVCHSLVVEPYGPEAAGITCAGPSGPFEVFDQATRIVDATRRYDTNGDVVERIRVVTFDDARLSNPATGRIVSYNQRDRDDERFTIPGDLGSAAWSTTGSITAVVPGIGAVLVERGRVTADPDGTIRLETGRRDFAAYLAGDETVLAAMCAYLGG